MSDTINSAIEFLKRIRYVDSVRIEFIKMDGSKRLMRCTLNFNNIPSKDKPKSVSLDKILTNIEKHGILHVYDLDVMAWRSVKFQNVKWVEIQNIRYTINK